ncbi:MULTISPECIES: hypothetical protein [unclassified Gordonia (in: high G+C Gram-positive bacteria)]|uniref:hypothetical protein n=1 Tax=unclassified Gordonia (in: high G+C Gram-positive bacteria) TaxID=2657482 RepID=UPI0009ACAD57|nr:MULTISPECIES: hypothetical protein [unclassified Gordonia (in: high G+C Gram-positive bacteria)]MDF3281450.1 hypothetical protein [Gordonia sp. N1V]OPX17209.1 hypothetical protein B1964_00820 [Gordonia sp. i37]
MPSRTMRALCATALSAAALAVAAPGLAQADGTQDPAYSGPVTPCDVENTPRSGGFASEPQNFPKSIGRTGPTSFVLNFNAEDEPDKFDVIYQNKQIATTGWRGSESANKFNRPLSGPGSGSIRVAVPRGSSSVVTVRVSTDSESTVWHFTAQCPN